VKAETWKVICRNKEWKIAGPGLPPISRFWAHAGKKKNVRVDGIKDFFPLLR
jgi:hypothetical protein